MWRVFNKTFRAGVGLALILAILFFPFNVTVAPEWKVRVVDQNGDPVKGAYVSELAINWTLDFRHSEAVCSDEDGIAQFPKRLVRASYMTRIWDTVSQIRPHSSFGHDVKIAVDALGYDTVPPDWRGLEWNGFLDRVNSSYTVRKCPEGLSGYQCRFDYDHHFENQFSGKRMRLCQSSPGLRFDPI
jgi:hypothetical protein